MAHVIPPPVVGAKIDADTNQLSMFPNASVENAKPEFVALALVIVCTPSERLNDSGVTYVENTRLAARGADSSMMTDTLSAVVYRSPGAVEPTWSRLGAKVKLFPVYK